MLRQFATAVFLLFAGSAAMAADEPVHTVIRSDGAIEIRDYEPYLIAEVEVRGEMGRASGAGFRPLANFIFGDNTAPAGDAGEIAMTSPVVQSRSEAIAMTAPVTQSRAEDSWRIGFIMPAQYSMETLPRPNDPDVMISERPARRIAAIRFSGGPNERRFENKAEELRAWLAAEGYEIVGEPVYARYDPPWTPTPFRRNEVLIEIAP